MFLALIFTLACNLPRAPKTPVPSPTPNIVSPTPVSPAEAVSTMVAGTATNAAAATRTQSALPYGEVKVDVFWFDANQTLSVSVSVSAPAGYAPKEVYVWLFDSQGINFLLGRGSNFDMVQQVTNQTVGIKVGNETEIYETMQVNGYGEYHWVIKVTYP